MNRIAGLINFEGPPVTPQQLSPMADALAANGEGKKDTWINGHIGMIRVTVSTPGRNRPGTGEIEFRGGRAALVFDGRLDNRPDLLAVLKHQLSSLGDTVSDESLVVAAYEKWGELFAEHLLGDFALAIWDRASHLLVCARDHFGAKPLYFYHSQRHFVFASSPVAVLASRKFPWVVDEGRIADFLLFSWEALACIDKTSTFYNDIHRLEPAHILLVRDRQLATNRYWRLRPAAEAAGATSEQCVARFRELLAEAVRCRLSSSGATGSALSGGIDSSAVVGTARKLLLERGKEALHTFSAISHERSRGERTTLGWHFNLLILNACAPRFRQVVLEEREALQPYGDTRKLLGIWDDFSAPGHGRQAESVWCGAALAMWLRHQRRLKEARG